MGYVCPVCEEPRVDAEDLANHVAFTAIIHGERHETWLDEHVEDWDQMDPETLGPLVAEHAESVELDVPEPDRDAGRSSQPTFEEHTDIEAMDATDRAILEEAREMTRQMLEDSESE